MGYPRQTHTYVTLEISAAAYDEIAGKLRDVDYHHVFGDSGEIDMHGLALTRAHAHREGPRNPQLPPLEQFNEFCAEPPCASDTCRRAKKCLHPT
jgi:hypothetical protein